MVLSFACSTDQRHLRFRTKVQQHALGSSNPLRIQMDFKHSGECGGGSKWRVRPGTGLRPRSGKLQRAVGKKELWKKACREYGATVRCNAKLGEMNVKVLFMNGKSKFCSLNHGPSTSSEERPHFMWDGLLMEH